MKGITPSQYVRPHMLTLDICQTVHDCTDTITKLTKLRARLNMIMQRISKMLGPKDEVGRWIFANEGGQRTYQRALAQTLGEVFAHGKKTHDGLQWFVMLHGMAEDCEDIANANKRPALAHNWKLVYRMMGWIYRIYEPDYDDVDENWHAGVALYDRVTKKIGMQR